MKTALLLGLCLAVTSVPSHSQTPATPAPQPGFEVASVRMVAPFTEDEIQRGLGNSALSSFPASRFTAHRLTLRLIIGLAYGVQQRDIQGCPNWIDSQHYDIEAKVEGDRELTYQQMQPLLQHLLEERFHLEVRRSTKEVEGYALVVAKGGPKLQPSEKKDSYRYILLNRIDARDTNMGGLASLLSSPAGRPVVDKTGLGGDWDFTLDYATANNANSNLPDLFTAVQEQLGLKLESQRVPVEFLVIDHIDRTPTDN